MQQTSHSVYLRLIFDSTLLSVIPAGISSSIIAGKRVVFSVNGVIGSVNPYPMLGHAAMLTCVT